MELAYIVVPVTDLLRVLNNALQGTVSTVAEANRTDLPVLLQHARVKWQLGVMFMSASDRYMAVSDSIPDSYEWEGSGEFLLHFSDIKSIVKAFKSTPARMVTLSLDSGKLTVSAEGSVSITVEVNEDDAPGFPDLDRVIPEWKDDARDYSQVAINPKFLARLAKLQGNEPGRPLFLQAGETATKPVSFRLGETVRGCVVPVRAS